MGIQEPQKHRRIKVQCVANYQDGFVFNILMFVLNAVFLKVRTLILNLIQMYQNNIHILSELI